MRAYIPIYDNMEPYEDNDTYAEDVAFFNEESCVQWIEEQKKILGRGRCRNERHYIHPVDIVDTPWISAKDRLPNDGDLVIMTLMMNGRKKVVISVFEHNAFRDNMGFDMSIDADLIAWMPLPEPYEEDE